MWVSVAYREVDDVPLFLSAHVGEVGAAAVADEQFPLPVDIFFDVGPAPLHPIVVQDTVDVVG